MELSGALLAKRLREFSLLMLMRKFEKVYHLVDSSTVLGYIHKEDTKLKPWEGVRVAEIQTAREFLGGRLKDWAWVEGENNPTDWIMKPRAAEKLGEGGFWQTEPDFLKRPIEEWLIKYSFRMDKFKGELIAKGVHMSMVAVVQSSIMAMLLDKYSSLVRLENVLTYVLRWSGQQKAGTKSITVDK